MVIQQSIALNTVDGVLMQWGLMAPRLLLTLRAIR